MDCNLFQDFCDILLVMHWLWVGFLLEVELQSCACKVTIVCGSPDMLSSDIKLATF